MRFSFEVDIEARCAKCGAACDVPEGASERVLQTDEAVYAESRAPCVCGSRSVCVKVKIG